MWYVQVKHFSLHVVRVCPINRLLGLEQGGQGKGGIYNSLKLRNMKEILSTVYCHLLSCERNSQGAEKQAPYSNRRSPLRS